MVNRKRLDRSLAVSAALLLAGCGSILGDAKVEYKKQGDIPEDPDGAAPLTQVNNVKPVFTLTKSLSDPKRIQLSVAGILNPVTKKPIELESNKTIYIEEDGRLQGTIVSQAESTNSLPYDIVFMIDNSGSMSEEADAVADAAAGFALELAASGLDVKLGVVGFNGDISGGHDLTSAQEISDFLNRKDASNSYELTGTMRTYGFSGASASALEQEAATLNAASPLSDGDENQVMPIYFAQEQFSWRANAQRVYIDFTDEGLSISQNSVKWKNHSEFSVKEFCKSWTMDKGVVHTVWSGYDQSQSLTFPFDENPADLSKCTGGSYVAVKTDASDLDLRNIETTQTLASAAMVEFISDSAEPEHEIKVTIVDGTGVDGMTSVKIDYSEK